jgi:hypothetical protein
MRMNIVFQETAHPPLSLRDISPTRGEIIPRQNLIPSAATALMATDQVFRFSNLPLCGGDVAKATEGGIAPSTFTEASAP